MVDDYDVGDVATFQLTVNPASSDTSATVRVVNPSGVIVPATPTANTGKSRWSANVTLDEPGVWEAVWSVTGTGAGTQSTEVRVRPPADLPVRRSYATTGELAAWLGTSPPPNASRVLARATNAIDDALRGAWYERDTANVATSARIRAGLRDAVCAQVEWWADNGDPDGKGVTDSWADVSIGSVKLSRGSRGTGEQDTARSLAPEAERELRLAGLLPIRPYVVG